MRTEKQKYKQALSASAINYPSPLIRPSNEYSLQRIKLLPEQTLTGTFVSVNCSTYGLES